MATSTEVKDYLGCWFQLGLNVENNKIGDKLFPKKIYLGDKHQYSPEFEQIWSTILLSPLSYYLEGSEFSIGELLRDNFEILNCSRCTLPSVSQIGKSVANCACLAVENWPDYTLPLPKTPQDLHRRSIEQIMARIKKCM